MYTITMIILLAIAVFSGEDIFYLTSGLFAIASAIDMSVYRYLKNK